MRSRPPSDWDSEVASRYALGCFLLLVFGGFTLLVAGPWIGIDAYFNVRQAPPSLLPVLRLLDHVGLRGLLVPLLLAMCVWIHHRTGRWRPFWVVVLGVLGQNFVVGLLKVLLARGQPGSMNPDFFVDGMAYPSGHSSNVMFLYGLVPYLLGRYTRTPRRVLRLLEALVALLSVCMIVVSVTLKWHWFGDLLAGLLIGGAVLAFTTGVDHAIPDDLFDDGVPRGLLRLPRVLLGRDRAC